MVVGEVKQAIHTPGIVIEHEQQSTRTVFLLQDLDTQRVYRLYDFNKAQRMQPNVAYCIAGKVNSADKLYLVIESVRLDTKHARCSIAPSPTDGAGGSATS